MTTDANPTHGGSAAIAGLAILTAQVSVNVGAALGKSLFGEIGPEGVAAIRTTISAILLLALVRPWTKLPTRREALWLVLYGLALGGMNLLIYEAIERIPIGIAVAIEVSGPLAVVLLASRTARDFLWLTLALAGLLLLTPWPGAEARLDPVGVACALAAAGCWALYIVFGKRASGVGGKRAVAIGMTVASALTLPLGAANAGTALLDSHVLALGLVVALLSSATPYMLEMIALERLSSRLFGLITSSAPAVAAVVGFLMLHERLTPAQWLAVALMVGASAGCSLTAGRR